MKGKLWELGPFALAVLVGIYFLVARIYRAPKAPVEAAASGQPRTGSAPRLSTGLGDPTKPEDFLPDPNSKPDPNSLPDPTASTMTRGVPAKK